MELGAIFSIKDNCSGGISSITNSVRGAEGALKGLNGTFMDANGRLHDAKGRFIGAGEGARQGGQGVSFFNGSIKNITPITAMKSELKKLAAQYLGVKTATNIVKSAITGGMGFESMRNTLNVVMKDTDLASQKFKEAVDFANATPFETKEIVEGFVKLESYGIKTTKEVTTSVGDMAGVMGKSYDQAVEAVADAQAGELERMKEFGIKKSDIVDYANTKMKNNNIVNNKGQITDQKAFNEAMFGLMNERFKGGMDLQSKTLSGSISTMKGVIGNTLSTLAGVTDDGTVKAGGAIDRLKNKVSEITQKVQEWANNGGVDKACSTMEKGFKMAGDSIKWVKDNMSWLVPVVAGCAGAFKALQVINSVKRMMDLWKVSTLATTVAQGGLNIAMFACPVTWIVLGIGLIIAAGIALWMNWDKVKAKCGELWAGLKEKWEGIKEACSPVTEWISEKWEGVKKKWEDVKQGCADFAEGVKEKWESMKEKCANVVESIKEKWESLKTFLAHPITGTISLIKNGDLSGVEADGSHATGLSRVPFDGYRAELHNDEMVLTKEEANAYRKGTGTNKNATSETKQASYNFNIEKMIVRKESDIDKIASTIVRKIKMNQLNYA